MHAKTYLTELLENKPFTKRHRELLKRIILGVKETAYLEKGHREWVEILLREMFQKRRPSPDSISRYINDVVLI